MNKQVLMTGNKGYSLPACIPISCSPTVSGTLQVLRLVVGGVTVTDLCALLSVNGDYMWFMFHRSKNP